MPPLIICLFIATLPKQAVSFISMYTCPWTWPSDIPQLSWDYCCSRHSVNPCLPLLVSGPYHLLSPPPHSSVSSGFSLLSHLLPPPLVWIFPKAQYLALIPSVSVHLLPENSLTLTASVVTCVLLMMLMSITSVFYYHFGRNSIEESLTGKPEALNIDTGKFNDPKFKTSAWLKIQQRSLKTTNKPNLP